MLTKRGGITHIGISMASVVWDFHGVGCLEFPSHGWRGVTDNKIASKIATGRYTIENEHIHIYTALNE